LLAALRNALLNALLAALRNALLNALLAPLLAAALALLSVLAIAISIAATNPIFKASIICAHPSCLLFLLPPRLSARIRTSISIAHIQTIRICIAYIARVAYIA
jgi:hypothetical protein